MYYDLRDISWKAKKKKTNANITTIWKTTNVSTGYFLSMAVN